MFWVVFLKRSPSSFPSSPASQEDVCSMNPLPGYHEVERLSLLLADIAEEEEGHLALSSEVRRQVFEAWGELKEHDKSPQRFHTVYRNHWGNTLYGRTKRDSLKEAAITQKINFRNAFTPAHTISAQKNRVVYCTVKQLWLRSRTKASPDKQRI